MNTPNDMQQVQIFVGLQTQWHGEPTYLAIVRLLQRQGAAGVTVLRGMLGFGSHRRIHSDALVDVLADSPVLIVWIDRPDRIERLMPQLQTMVEDGLIVRSQVTAVHVQQRLLDHFPADLHVRHVMTSDVVTTAPDTPVAEIADLFLHSGLRTIPVVTADRRVVGIVTDGDLLRRGNLALPLSIREALQPEEVAAIAPQADLTAGSIMTINVVGVPEDLPIAAAIDVMAKRGFKRLPVLDREGRLAGIVSRADILQTVAHVVPHATPQHTPGGTIQRVADVMETDVPTVRFDTPLTAIVEALAEVEQRRVVVIDARAHVVGIITDGDVIRRASAEERPGIVHRMLERLRGDATHQRYLVSERTGVDVMTAPVVTISEDATPGDAIRLMLQHRVKRLPVVNRSGRLVGLIGRAGVLRALSEAT